MMDSKKRALCCFPMLALVIMVFGDISKHTHYYDT